MQRALQLPRKLYTLVYDKVAAREVNPIEKKPGRAALHYVYEGNVPGEGGENTYCYNCGAQLIERYGFFVRQNRIAKGCLPECEAAIDGIERNKE